MNKIKLSYTLFGVFILTVITVITCGRIDGGKTQVPSSPEPKQVEVKETVEPTVEPVQEVIEPVEEKTEVKEEVKEEPLETSPEADPPVEIVPLEEAPEDGFEDELEGL